MTDLYPEYIENFHNSIIIMEKKKKGEVWTEDQHVKKCSTLVAVREMQSKTTMRRHYKTY